ncbi:MAG: AEC family transporter [Coleofasciculaceae cyanobacterium RL_1_1]|nr:AEC family transporter [Coleofasciculaceae cyanobacterium RL_1_1]
MGETLLQAYTPLLFWVTVGAVLLRITPDRLPRLLGRTLFWVGVPLEVFVLARHGDFSSALAIAPVSLVVVVTINIILGGLAWNLMQRTTESGMSPHSPPGTQPHKVFRESVPSESILSESILGESVYPLAGTSASEQDTSACDVWHSASRRRQGSFILAGLLGNTGFVGFALLPLLVPEEHLGAAICYQVSNNVLVTSGIGVLIASHFGRSSGVGLGWQQVRDILGVPSLWAFALGVSTQAIAFPESIEAGLDASIWVVIAAALILMGMRLSQIQGWDSLKESITPSLLKILVMPAIAGLGLTAIGITGYLRLVLVLMAGMPTAFAGLILVEEYDIDAPLMASSILVSTVGLLATLPLWLGLFGS